MILTSQFDPLNKVLVTSQLAWVIETNKTILEDYRKKNPNADVSVQEKKLEILGNAYDHLQSVWEQLLAEKSRNRDLEEINLELKMKVRDFEEEHLSNKL